MNRTAFIVIIIAILIGSVFVIANSKNGDTQTNGASTSNNENGAEQTDPMEPFVECLADEGLVVYASRTCPACRDFVSQFGGYDAVEPIYVECGGNSQECQDNMQTNFVPELQFNGTLYSGDTSLQALSLVSGCPLEQAE
jgi:hypothetical protein